MVRRPKRWRWHLAASRDRKGAVKSCPGLTVFFLDLGPSDLRSRHRQRRLTADCGNVDLPREQASGLIQVREILAGIDGIGFVEFGNEDVVRHKLVQRIVEAYKRHAEETGTARRR